MESHSPRGDFSPFGCRYGSVSAGVASPGGSSGSFGATRALLKLRQRKQLFVIQLTIESGATRAVRYGFASMRSLLGRVRTTGAQKDKGPGARESNSAQHNGDFFQFRTYNMHSFFKTPTPLTQASSYYRWLAR